MHAAHPVHSPDVTTSWYRWAQCGFSGGMRPTVASCPVPELPEVEAYRRLAERALGRPISSVVLGDPRFLRGPTSPRRLRHILRGASFDVARRRGKLLVLDLGGTPPSTGHRLGIRFGMTGSLLVDGSSGVEELIYSSRRVEKRWERFAVHFADGGSLVVHDPRLLGGVSLDPDEELLGPDATTLTLAQLRGALDTSAAPLKARLMDQARLAGVGNLLADEILWRAGLAPGRRSPLTEDELRELHRSLRATLRQLARRGGSHMGDLMEERRDGGLCPLDGTALRREVVGGRTTYWCPAHQR
jgi:formamidopyrimidine-DNA glycosylase